MPGDLYAKLAEPPPAGWRGRTTRYLCNITGCEWYHDSPDMPDAAEGPWPWKGSIEDSAFGAAMARAKAVDAIIREHFESHSIEEWAREVADLKGRVAGMAALAERATAEAVPAMLALPCTGCVLDAKQAIARGADVPEPLPGAVMINGMLICDVRHTLNVGSPQLLIAQPGQMPHGGLG